ncbi:leucine efflux protein [Chitiniphilus shinanonensis]|uniref:Leucine efflux protein n=1 Tax=Chitiniphilus shinanonensis TaxID=553088 RepID=A0ABQ6BRC9_9NEIS|nr:leucine efflux protein LeuE [Chitiniphilus shinanonensis]GLS04356.1 leucine efflux protein [Chitiniphilus shinanonensis]
MSLLGISDLATYLIGTLVIILTPGPNSLFVLTTASRHGQRAGFAAAGGVFVGDLVLMTAAALGVASLMHAYPVAFDLVRYAGAAYLGWLGLKALLLRKGPAATAPQAADPRHAFRQALAISLVNVKAILFCMAFFPQFVDPGYPHVAVTFAALGLIVQVTSMSYLSVLILAGSRIVQRLAQRRWLAGLANKLTGLLFVSFGLRLATSR